MLAAGLWLLLLLPPLLLLLLVAAAAAAVRLAQSGLFLSAGLTLASLSAPWPRGWLLKLRFRRDRAARRRARHIAELVNNGPMTECFCVSGRPRHACSHIMALLYLHNLWFFLINSDYMRKLFRT